MLADLFSTRERWLLASVVGLGIVAACFESIGVASILPFMHFALNLSSIERYPRLIAAAQVVGVTTPQGILFGLGAMTAALIALSNAVSALNLLVSERFGIRTRTILSTRLLAGYLAQPYAFHVRRDAPSLLKVILGDVPAVVTGSINTLLTMTSKVFVILSILGLLLLQEPYIAITVLLILVTAYVIVFAIVRKRQGRYAARRNTHNIDRYRISQEALGGVKELQILGRERFMVERFEAANHGAAKAEASNRIAGNMPRYLLETVAFGTILLVTLSLLAERAASEVIPILSLYVFASYRLLPAVHQIFNAMMTFRFNLHVLDKIHRDLILIEEASTVVDEAVHESMPTLQLNREICLNKLGFGYPGAASPALRDVDLVIRANQSLGLVGRTGAGKTTLADLILGIHSPSTGSISIDGVSLSGPAIRAWRRQVGYVPQHVFLSNASVAENIAFGLPKEEINLESVRRAAHLAQADEFINALPLGFDTLVGERGVKLSGGQRQRIGIARALYNDPQVLVFDEATSALDGLTEEALMAAIRNLGGARTIVLIAHRLRTVEACDRIVMLDQGRIVAEGSYEELLANSAIFREFVGTVREANTGT